MSFQPCVFFVYFFLWNKQLDILEDVFIFILVFNFNNFFVSIL